MLVLRRPDRAQAPGRATRVASHRVRRLLPGLRRPAVHGRGRTRGDGDPALPDGRHRVGLTSPGPTPPETAFTPTPWPRPSMVVVAYQGERGTFTEEALLAFFEGRGMRGTETLACPSFADAVRRVEAGEAHYAFLPLENTMEG